MTVRAKINRGFMCFSKEIQKEKNRKEKHFMDSYDVLSALVFGTSAVFSGSCLESDADIPLGGFSNYLTRAKFA